MLVQIIWALNINFSSANANPKFEGRGGEELANDIASMLSQAYGDKNTLDMRKLCIADGQHCWILYIDVLVGLYNLTFELKYVTLSVCYYVNSLFCLQLLEVGGNLYDAVSLAVKSALYDTK